MRVGYRNAEKDALSLLKSGPLLERPDRSDYRAGLNTSALGRTGFANGRDVRGMTLAAARTLAQSFRVQIRYGASLFKAVSPRCCGGTGKLRGIARSGGHTARRLPCCHWTIRA